jgi:[ribosomal protein S5]-alanine N-acetyltransferase
MDTFPVLETQRLVLREFRPQDAQAVFEIFSQEIVTRSLDSLTMQSVAEAEEKVTARINLFKDGQGYRWGITLRQHSEQIVGSCGFYLLNPRWFSCETGYELHPAHWRQGIMTEALKAIIDFAYSDRFPFPLNRIQALTYAESPGSIGLLRKLSFQEEGIRRAYAYWKNQFHDLRCFSLLRQDWEG